MPDRGTYLCVCDLQPLGVVDEGGNSLHRKGSGGRVGRDLTWTLWSGCLVPARGRCQTSRRHGNRREKVAGSRRMSTTWLRY